MSEIRRIIATGLTIRDGNLGKFSMNTAFEKKLLPIIFDFSFCGKSCPCYKGKSIVFKVVSRCSSFPTGVHHLFTTKLENCTVAIYYLDAIMYNITKIGYVCDALPKEKPWYPIIVRVFSIDKTKPSSAHFSFIKV